MEVTYSNWRSTFKMDKLFENFIKISKTNIYKGQPVKIFNLTGTSADESFGPYNSKLLIIIWGP